jgi:hypothetical protein
MRVRCQVLGLGVRGWGLGVINCGRCRVEGAEIAGLEIADANAIDSPDPYPLTLDPLLC